MIAAADLEARLADIEPIGLDPAGATTRLAWTPEDAAAGAWFAAQAAGAGLRVERDPGGNRWAVPDAPAPWWGIGSHLDSVRQGGRYDGALGVCAAFEVAARAARPVAVIAFADEEGARFNTPTFGSRALVGRLDTEEVLARRDDDGVLLAAALATAGVDPAGLRDTPSWLGRLRGFLELHVAQAPDLDGPWAVVRGLASRMRIQADLHGRADHAGTTRRAERSDALLAAARLIVAADELAAGAATGAAVPARPGEPAARREAAAEHDPLVAAPGRERSANGELLVTASRVLVEPNALTTIASHVRLWLDARAAEPAPLDAWLEALRGCAEEGTTLAVASRSDGIDFDADVRRALGERDGRGVLCFAGHDAGILAERLPAGMVLVRNATGVSHAPEEAVDLADAARAAEALLAALERLP